MKCVAERNNQQRIASKDNPKGKIVFFNRGDVFDFEKCPSSWRAIEAIKDPETGEIVAPDIDFETASEDELLEGEYDDDQLREFIKEKYNAKPGNRKREGLVALLLDLRFRELDTVQL